MTTMLPNNPLRFRVKGKSADYPFIIMALMLNRAVGDFIDQNLFAASIKLMFDHSKLYVYYRDDRPYKKQIIELNPHIDRQIVVSDKSAILPVDYFDIVSDRPITAPDPSWYDAGLSNPDLLLTPSMMTLENLISFDYVAQFKVPEKNIDGYTRHLIELGLDPNLWFMCLHYREPTYQYRPASSLRDMNPDDFIQLASHVIDRLGGQVVRLGHPGMRAFPTRPRFVDLSPHPDSFDLQAFAVSRARFTITSPSGMSILGCAFDVPIGIVNCTMPWGPHRSHDLLLAPHLITPDGFRVSTTTLVDRGILMDGHIHDLVTHKGYRLIRNTVAEICATADLLYRETQNVDKWRVSKDSIPPQPRPNQLVLPYPRTRRPRIIDFPDAAPPFPLLVDRPPA